MQMTRLVMLTTITTAMMMTTNTTVFATMMRMMVMVLMSPTSPESIANARYHQQVFPDIPWHNCVGSS